jgi:hypothetical protein
MRNTTWVVAASFLVSCWCIGNIPARRSRDVMICISVSEKVTLLQEIFRFSSMLIRIALLSISGQKIVFMVVVVF